MASGHAGLSPGIEALVAFGAVEALEFVRRRTGVRRDYESIYSLGVAFAAFAGAEAVHGSGFLAAFAAGLRYRPSMSSYAIASSNTARPRRRWLCSSRLCCLGRRWFGRG